MAELLLCCCTGVSQTSQMGWGGEVLLFLNFGWAFGEQTEGRWKGIVDVACQHLAGKSLAFHLHLQEEVY